MNIYLSFIDVQQWYLEIIPYFGFMKWTFVFICSFMGIKFVWSQLHELGGLVFAFFYILITDDAQEFREFKKEKYIGKALSIVGKNQKSRLEKVFAMFLKQIVNQIWFWFLEPSQKYLTIYYKTRRYMHLSTTHHDAEKEVGGALSRFVYGKKIYSHPLHFIGKWLVIMHFKGSDCRPSLKALKTLVNLDNDCAKETKSAEKMVEDIFSELIRYRFKGEIKDDQVNLIKTQLTLTIRELNEVFEKMSAEQNNLHAFRQTLHESDQNYIVAHGKACDDFKLLSSDEKEKIVDTEEWLSNKSSEHMKNIVRKKSKDVTERFEIIQKQLGETGSSLTKRRATLKSDLKEAEEAYHERLIDKFDKTTEYWFELLKMQVDVKKLTFWERCLNQVIWEDEMTMKSLKETIADKNLKIHNNDFTTLEAYQLTDQISRSKDELAAREVSFKQNHARRDELNNFHAENLDSVLTRKKNEINSFLSDKPIFTLPPALTAETKGQ